MTAALRWFLGVEIVAALRLGALGQWWAASAARRLKRLSAREKNSGDRSSVLKDERRLP